LSCAKVAVKPVADAHPDRRKARLTVLPGRAPVAQCQVAKSDGCSERQVDYSTDQQRAGAQRERKRAGG